MNWTPDEAKAYMQKRLKDEQPARAKIQAKNGYNPVVVLAFLKEHGIPAPEFEFRFDPARRWRSDLSWQMHKVCLECQGGIFSGGAHVRGAAMLREFIKLNRLAVMGWRVLYCTPQTLCTKEMADTIREALAI